MTLEQGCEAAILEYAPYYRQINAMNGEFTEYVSIVLTFHRTHYAELLAGGETEWRELPAQDIVWLNENKPY